MAIKHESWKHTNEPCFLNLWVEEKWSRSMYPLLFHYYFTVRQPASTYTRTRGTWGSKPFYVSSPRLRAFTRFKLSPSRAWTTAVSRANNGQGQIIFAPYPLSSTSGWSVDIPDIIVFDGDFRSSVKRLYLLIEQALNRAWPSPHSPLRRSKRISAMGSRARRLQFRTVLYIYIYIYSLVLPDYSFPGQDISQGELRVHVARGAIETNIRNVEIRGNVWAGGLAS